VPARRRPRRRAGAPARLGPAHHASRLFHQGLGLPLRRYALSIKIRAAASFMGSGLSLTQIAQAAGFVDSAHFAKVWSQCYGAAPSRFFDTGCTHIDQADQPDWLLWYLAQRDRDLPPPAADAQTPWVQPRTPARHARTAASASH
jgi:AraC-like DNA-binding protein